MTPSLLFALLGCVARAPLAPDEPPSVHLRTFDEVWRLVHENHPYPERLGEAWAAARDELRPRAAAAESAEALRPVVRELLGRLGESHYALVPAEAPDFVGLVQEAGRLAAGEAPLEDGEAGLELRVIEGELVVSRVHGAAAEAGLRPGWVLKAVDDQDTAALLDGPFPFDGRVETFAPLGARGWLDGHAGEARRLSLLDGDGQAREVSLTLQPAQGEPVELGLLPTVYFRFEADRPQPELGRVAFNVFMTTLTPHLERAIPELADARGLVIDLRGNPGGVAGLAAGLAGFIVDTPGKSLGRMVTREGELEFRVFPRPEASRFDGPVAVLIDELSLSTSELAAAGLQELGEARLIGATTGGMALPSRFERLPNGDVLQFAFADLLDPAGERLEGEGVAPDLAAPLTREALLAGRDPALDAAACWILQSDGACP